MTESFLSDLDGLRGADLEVCFQICYCFYLYCNIILKRHARESTAAAAECASDTRSRERADRNEDSVLLLQDSSPSPAKTSAAAATSREPAVIKPPTVAIAPRLAEPPKDSTAGDMRSSVISRPAVQSSFDNKTAILNSAKVNGSAMVLEDAPQHLSNRDETGVKNSSGELLKSPGAMSPGLASPLSKVPPPDNQSLDLCGRSELINAPVDSPSGSLSIENSPARSRPPDQPVPPVLDSRSFAVATAPRIRPPESPGDSVMSRQLSAPPTDTSFQTFMSPGSIAQDTHPRGGTRLTHAMIEEDRADEDDLYGNDGYASSSSSKGSSHDAAAAADASWEQHVATERARLKEIRSRAREYDDAGAAQAHYAHDTTTAAVSRLLVLS